MNACDRTPWHQAAAQPNDDSEEQVEEGLVREDGEGVVKGAPATRKDPRKCLRTTPVTRFSGARPSASTPEYFWLVDILGTLYIIDLQLFYFLAKMLQPKIGHFLSNFGLPPVKQSLQKNHYRRKHIDTDRQYQTIWKHSG